MIKIGQIGMGHNHAEGKMNAVRKFPDLFEVVGICENDPETCSQRGSLHCYEGLAIMSEDQLLSDCDAVLVECNIQNLTAVAQRCIDAGKHIHMDKPASGTLQDYKILLDEAKQKKLVIQLGYMYRYNPAVQKCIQLIRENQLGEIYSVNAEMSTCHTPQYRTWLSQFDGGTMKIFGCHLVDLIVYMLGEPLKVHSFLKSSGKDGIMLADNNQAILEYEKAIARINVSSVEVNGWGRRQLVVNGSDASVEIKPVENPAVMTYTDKSVAVSEYENHALQVKLNEVKMEDRYDEMIKDFYAYIKGFKINPYNYDHEYCTQKVLAQVCADDNLKSIYLR